MLRYNRGIVVKGAVRAWFVHSKDVESWCDETLGFLEVANVGWEGPAKKHVFWNKGFEGVSTPGVAALRLDSTEVDEGYAGYLERALRAQDTAVRVLTPKMLVPGGEYEEVLSGFLTSRIRRRVYVGQFQWEARGTYGYQVQTGRVFKKQCIFWDRESGIFSPVDLKDLNMSLSPKVVPELGQLVELMKKTRFTSLPGTHKLEVGSVAEALLGGWFWTGEVEEDETEDVRPLRLYAIRKGTMGLEVRALREMWVRPPYVQDYGLSELRDGPKAASYLRSEAEVASMQPKRLVLRQENGLEIKREDYGQPVKKTAEGTFEIMRKWD